MRNQKGITLIALVVTIIVLLILAGISVAMLTGNNGLITQANKAKIANAEGAIRDAVVLAVSAYRAENYNQNQSTLSITGENIKADMEETLGDDYTVTPSGQNIEVTGGDLGSATTTVVLATNGTITSITTAD